MTARDRDAPDPAYEGPERSNGNDETPPAEGWPAGCRPVVVVDTTTIFNHLRLGGGRWPELLAHSTAGAVRVVVPEVVIREATRHHSRAVSTAEKSIAQVKVNLGKLGFVEIPALDELSAGVTAAPAGYEDWLRNRLEDAGVEIADYPSIDHRRLVEWDIEGRQPFREEKSEGYRDALLWATVLDVLHAASDDEGVVLVTANTKDFCLDRDLAPALRRDVEEVAPGHLVRWFARLPDFLDHLVPYLETVRPAQPPPESQTDDTTPRIPDDHSLLVPSLVAAAEGLRGREIADPDDEHSTGVDVEFLLPSEMQNPTILNVAPDDSTVTWAPYAHYDGGTVLGEASIEADLEIDGFAYKSDLYLAEPEDFSILDSGWNDHMAWVEIVRRVVLTFHVHMVPDIERIEELDLLKVELWGEVDPH